jgi:hypothetical protein
MESARSRTHVKKMYTVAGNVDIGDHLAMNEAPPTEVKNQKRAPQLGVCATGGKPCAWRLFLQPICGLARE